jgi:hypothetical protein
MKSSQPELPMGAHRFPGRAPIAASNSLRAECLGFRLKGNKWKYIEFYQRERFHDLWEYRE